MVFVQSVAPRHPLQHVFLFEKYELVSKISIETHGACTVKIINDFGLEKF